MKTMVRVLAMIMISFLLMGATCSQVQIRPPNPFVPPPADRPCTIYQDNAITTGIVFNAIKNPCDAQQLVMTIVNTGFIAEAYNIEQFNKWTDKAITFAKSGITGYQLQKYLMDSVLQLNKEFKAAVFGLGSYLGIFSTNTVLFPDDVKLVTMSLMDVKKQVNLFPLSTKNK